jgi:hypothetical protein
LAVPFPFVHLHTAHGRPYESLYSFPQNVRSHAYMASCFGPPTTGEWVHLPTYHIICMRSLRFSLSSHRQNCNNHSMRLEKCLKSSSFDNWRVGNSVDDKP